MPSIDVLIVGAGIAGLSAADRLHRNGVIDFKILDASNRVGGRICPTVMDRHRVQRGASLIHGVLGNPIYDLALRNRLVDITHSPRPRNVCAVTEQGQRVPLEVVQEVWSAYSCFIRRCEEYHSGKYQKPAGISNVGEHLQLEIKLYLDQRFPTDDADRRVRRVRRRLFSSLMRRESCVVGCQSLNDIGLMSYGSFCELPGGNIEPTCGMDGVANTLCRSLPPGSVLLGHEVTEIHWRTNSIKHCHIVGQTNGVDDNDRVTIRDSGIIDHITSECDCLDDLSSSDSYSSDETVVNGDLCDGDGGDAAPAAERGLLKSVNKSHIVFNTGPSKLPTEQSSTSEKCESHRLSSACDKNHPSEPIVNGEMESTADGDKQQQRSGRHRRRRRHDVKVVCSNGTVFRCHHVICSLPLGVLKRSVPLPVPSLGVKESPSVCDKGVQSSPSVESSSKIIRKLTTAATSNDKSIPNQTSSSAVDSGGVTFVPELPEYKADAIRRLGFGTVDKIHLEYDRPFLSSDVTELILLWDDDGDGVGSGSDDRQKSPLNTTGQVSSSAHSGESCHLKSQSNPTGAGDHRTVNGEEDNCERLESSPSWIRGIHSFTKITDTLLLTWICGWEAEHAETLTTEEIGRQCTLLLRRFLGDACVPEPRRCDISRWHADAYFGGSYTSVAVGSSSWDMELVAQPLYARPEQSKPTVMFVGEHTHPTFYSTLHGAFLSGVRAADDLLRPDSPPLQAPREEEVVSRNITLNESTDEFSRSWLEGLSLE